MLTKGPFYGCHLTFKGPGRTEGGGNHNMWLFLENVLMLESRTRMFRPWDVAIVAQVQPSENTVAGLVCGWPRVNGAPEPSDVHMIATLQSFRDQSAAPIPALRLNQTFKSRAALAEA